MAFDMYAGKRHEKIEHHEEGLFSLIESDDQYPLLNDLWVRFYNGPRISAEHAKRLALELIQLGDLLRSLQTDEVLLTATHRLAEFFNHTHP